MSMIEVEPISNTISDTKKLLDLIDKAPYPASAVSSTGEVLRLNDKMIDILGASMGGEQIKCEWIKEKVDESCPECSERPTLEGRCFITREGAPNNLLLAAARVPSPSNALIRFYAYEKSAGPADMRDAVIRLLEHICGQRKRVLLLDAEGLCRTRMGNVIEPVLNMPPAPDPPIIDESDPDIELEGTNIFLLRRGLHKTLLELSGFEIKNGVTICSESNVEPHSREVVHTITLETRIARNAGKSALSEIMAMRIRLESFFACASAVSGFILNAPEILFNGDSLHARLSFPGRLKSASDPFGKNRFHEKLSARERVVVEMARAGYDNGKIAKALGITHATIKQHLKSIYKKIGVKSRLELIFKTLKSPL